MPAGTPTESDSYWLSQSPVFAHRVQMELDKFLSTIENEASTGLSGAMPTLIHQARASFVKTITNPSQFSSWLTRFVEAAAADGNLISAATNATVTYTPITSAAQGDSAAAEGGLVTTTLVSNAIAAAFDTFVPGI